MCEMRRSVSSLFSHYCCLTSSNDTMLSNSCETEVLDVDVVIKASENTNEEKLQKSQNVVDSNIKILDNNKFECRVCKCVLPSEDHILPHIKGKQHKTTLSQPKIEKNNLKLLENTACSKENKKVLSNCKVFKHNEIGCNLCQIMVGTMHNYLQHIKGKKHVIQLKKSLRKDSKYNLSVNNACDDELTENIIEIQLEELKDKNEQDEEVQSSIYDCELCSERISINDLFAHINTHRYNQTLNSAKDIILYKCICCKSIIEGDTSFIRHMKKNTHLQNVKNILKLNKAETIEIYTTNDGQNTSEKNNSILFTILSPKVENTSGHFEEKCLISLNSLNIKYSSKTGTNIDFSCSICREILSSNQLLIQHCQRKMHQQRIKSLFSSQKDESNIDSETWSLLNNLYKLSIIDNSNSSQSSDSSDESLIISNAVYKQLTKTIEKSPFVIKTKDEHHQVKPKRQQLISRLNKLYCMEYIQLEKEMYTLTEKKINDIKLHFKFFIEYKTYIYCMVCNQKVSNDLYLLYEHTRLLQHKANVKTQTKCNIFTQQYIRIDILHDKEKSIEESNKKATKEVVTCGVCKSQIKDITSHIVSKVHKQNHKKNDNFVDTTVDSILKDLRDLYYSIQRFTCVICNKGIRYKIEFMEHIQHTHQDMLKKGNYMFDFCVPCASLWFSKSDSYSEHCNDIVHKYLLKSNDFMVDDLPNCIRRMLTEIKGITKVLLKETEDSSKDHVQEEVRKSLETKAKVFYPQAKAYLFGSRLIGLGFTNSDIDIYIDSGNKYYENNDKVGAELSRVKEAVCTDEDVWEVKEVLQGCRVPIIKLIYKPRNLDCDVSFVNGLSVEKSKLLRSFNNVCSTCKMLTLFVKKWFSFINLPGGHGFINYALYWLIIYYLQEREHLPSVAELIEETHSSEFIGDWQVGFAAAKCKTNHEHSLTVLLQGFFDFYANFDYQQYIVCPLMGSFVAKTDFIELHRLPRAMQTYVKHLKTSSKREFLRTDSPLCVQDPLELSQNLTKGVTSITLKYFRQYCKECAAILKSKVN